MTRLAARLLPVLLLLASGCSLDVRRTVDVGPHRVRLEVPVGWRLVDQGRRQVLRRGESRLVLQDMGPVNRTGLRRAIERARTLWQRGLAGEARTMLRALPIGPEYFATTGQRDSFGSLRHELVGASDDPGPDDVTDRFARLLAAVDGLQPREPGEVAGALLLQLGEDTRRDVARRIETRIDGRPAVFVETWNRLSHADRRRFAFVIDQGEALALGPDRVLRAADTTAFEAAWRSLQFVPTADTPAGGVRRRSD